jgi:hypothetical protein
MTGEPEARAFPRGLEEEFPNGPPTVIVTHRGCQLLLRFAPGDFAGEGELQELRLLPETEELRLGALLQFVPHAKEYLGHARAAMRILGPEGSPKERWENFRSSAQALREIAGPGRGLSDRFYREIAENYFALVSEGERHPVKALAELHTVTISAASRWIKEARRRGYIKESENG